MSAKESLPRIKRHARTTMRRTKTVRGEKLRALGAPNGLETIGFRRALQRLVTDFSGYPDEEEFVFGEWFGDVKFVPAGYVIERREDGRGIWDYTVHVYEIEASAQVPLWKIGAYGRMADGEGPLFCLHIIDRHGRERVFDNETLAALEFYCFCSKRKLNPEQRKECDETLRELLKGSGPDASLPKSERTRKWKAAYDALRELGVSFDGDGNGYAG